MATVPRTRALPAKLAPRTTPDDGTLRGDANVQNITAGLIAIITYFFGAIPVLLGVLVTLNLTASQLSSWIFIVFLTSGIGSVVLSLRYRQPIAIGWSVPALMLIGSVGPRYSASELAGASLVAGSAVLLLGVLGAGKALTRWLPLPLVLAMFAGSTLHYVTGIFTQLGAQPVAVGAALAGFLFARHCSCAWMPPVGGAVLSGLVATLAMGQTRLEAVAWALPALELGAPSVGAGSLLALSLPLLILTIGTGNVQGIGLLMNQGYRPPVNAITTTIGISSIVNALFGGHTASVQSAAGAILVSEEAGKPGGRYVASVLAGFGCVVIAGMAAMAGSMLGVLPVALVLSLAGIAILRTLMDAVEKSVTTDLRLGAFFAFAIAASPLTILGIGPALWAIAGGYLVSLIVERPALFASLQRAEAD